MGQRLVFLLCLAATVSLLGSSPVSGAALDLRVATGNDDAEEHLNAGMDLTSSDLEIPYEDEGAPATDEQLIGMRWSVPLAKDAVLQKAYIEFVLKEVKGSGTNDAPVNVVIEGQLAPNPPAFTSAAKNITNRPRTKAQVKWTLPPGLAVEAKLQTPDVLPIIKELLSQDGWASGNAMVLIIRDDKDKPSTGLRTVYTNNGAAAKAPLLHLDVFVPQATKPDPADGAKEVTSPLFQWVAGDGAVSHQVYVGTKPELGDADKAGAPLPMAMYFHIPGLTPGVTYYWRVDETAADGTVTKGTVWSFTVSPLEAHLPSPYDGQLWRALDTKLTWTAGQGAVKHKVFLSADQALVTAGDAKALAGESATTDFTPANLASNTMYYWRVDEVDSMGKVAAGPVWKFSTIDTTGGAVAEYWNDINLISNNVIALAGAPAVVTTVQSVNFAWADGTQNGVNSPDPAINTNYFAARYTAVLNVPVSGAYTFYVASDEGGRLFLNGVQIAGAWVNRGETENASAVQNLEAGQQYILVMETYEAGGGAAARLRWAGPGITKEIIPPGALQIPKFAVSPLPREGEVEVAENAVMSFTPGQNTIVHTVYFGTDQKKVAASDASVGQPPSPQAKYVRTTPLARNTTYYWKVEEMAADGTTSTSPIWSFKTADWAVVQPATVTGLLASKTLNYDNSKAPFLSQLAFDVPTNLTTGGITDLALRFSGLPASLVDNGDNSFTIRAAGADIYNQTDEFRYVFKTLAGDGSITVRVDSLTVTNAWAKAGVMIRESLDPVVKSVHTIISGSNGFEFQYRTAAKGNTTQFNTSGGTPKLPQWLRLTRKGDTFTGETSADGVTWAKIVVGTSTSVQDLVMTGPVYIGMAVTSHVANTLTLAQFSKVEVVGATGEWQEKAIAGSHATNSRLPLYVSIEDKTGKLALVTNPKPDATTQMNNQNQVVMDLWRVPMSSFTGVDLKNVAKLYVGVGDGKTPGTGTMTFADIRILKPVTAPDPNAVDVTVKGDPLVGIPNDGVGSDAIGGWPAAEVPANAIDDDITKKYLHFKGDAEPTGFSVTPSLGATVVTGLTFTTANDAVERDPVKWELYGSNKADGPWALIASGTIDDFARPWDWPRRWKNVTPIAFSNVMPFTNYKVMFPTVKRQINALPVTPNSMQIAEVELLGKAAAAGPVVVWVSFHGNDNVPSSGAKGVGFTTAVDKGYTDLLKANGYNVVRYVQTATPNVDVLNAAALVIASRSVASGSFQSAAADLWNSVSAPMIVTNGYLSRKSRLGYNSGSGGPTDITGDIKLTVKEPTHPIFAGIALTNGTMTNAYAGLATYPTDKTKAAGISIVTEGANADGKTLATLSAASGAAAGSLVIAEWQVGGKLIHDGGAGTNTLTGHRLVFLTGSRENGGKSSETAGMYDLYDDGAKMFLNAVAYMMK